jgi:hypothetical protein
VSLENWISFVREGGSDDFFNAGSTRSIGEQSRVNAVAGNYSQLFRELSANCHSEQSEAESKNPAKLAKTDATGFLDYARNDVTSFSRGGGV